MTGARGPPSPRGHLAAQAYRFVRLFILALAPGATPIFSGGRIDVTPASALLVPAFEVALRQFRKTAPATVPPATP